MTDTETQRLRDLGFAPCPKCGRWRPADAPCLLCEPPAKPKRVKGSRRKPETPRSKVRAAIRQVSLRCRERAAAMKAAGYKCELCGAKQSVAVGREVKIQAHHRDPIAESNAMTLIIDLIFAYILVPPERWQCLCERCHEMMHETEPQELAVGSTDNKEVE